MELSKMPDSELERLTEVMKAIAHPVRLKILCLLKEGRMNVTELEGALGVGQAPVSQQLRLLRLNGLVQPERENGFVYYQIVAEKKKYLRGIMSSLCHV